MAIARPVDRRLFLLLDRARNRLFKRANKELLHSANITVAQAAALFFLGRHDGCLLSDIAHGLDLNNSAITGLSDRMHKAGLIERKSCPEDGRAMRIYLSEKGRGLLDQVQQTLRRFNEDIARDFSDEEMDVVYRFLSRTAGLGV